MALVMNIMELIAQPIGELADWLQTTYQINSDEVLGKWKELSGMNITIVEGEVVSDKVEAVNIKSAKNNKLNKKIPKTKELCQHTFLSGSKIGEQCTTKPKGGAIYCSAHKPKNSADKPAKKKKEKVELDPNFNSESDVESKPAKKKKELDTEKKSKKGKKKPFSSDNDSDIENKSDPELKPLLKKKGAKNGPVKFKKYDTDDEHIDQELNLSEEE